MIDYIKQSPQTYTSFLVWKHDQTCLVYVIYKYSSWLVLYFNWLLIISMESYEKDIALVIKLLHVYECAALKWPFLTVYLVDESIMCTHHCDVIMSAMASQITGIWSVYSTFYWSADQRKHQSSASLAFVRGIHRRPVNSPHKEPETWEQYHCVFWWSAYPVPPAASKTRKCLFG